MTIVIVGIVLIFSSTSGETKANPPLLGDPTTTPQVIVPGGVATQRRTSATPVRSQTGSPTPTRTPGPSGSVTVTPTSTSQPQFPTAQTPAPTASRTPAATAKPRTPTPQPTATPVTQSPRYVAWSAWYDICIPVTEETGVYPAACDNTMPDQSFISFYMRCTVIYDLTGDDRPTRCYELIPATRDGDCDILYALGRQVC